METVIHQLADRLSMKQLFGIAVEQKIDSSDMNSEMICLSEEHTVGQTTWNCLMRVTGDEYCHLRELRGQSHYSIRKIVAAGAHFQSHVATEHDRIYPLAVCSRYRPADGFNRILELDAAREFRGKPIRHSRRCHADDRQLDSRDFLHDERLDLREWMLQIGTCAGRLSVQDRVCSQHLHCRSLQRIDKRLDSPIELMIAGDPCVVFEMIKEIDHQLALVAQTDVRPLRDVAHVDQNRIRILPSPSPSLRRATR